MNHIGDEQSSAEETPPLLPTEIEHLFPSADRARRYLSAEDPSPLLPTEIEHPYPPTPAGPAYQPKRTGPGESAAADPSYIRAYTEPTGQSARAGRADLAAELTRFGPGVHAPPPTGATHTAERIWRTGHAAGPRPQPRRWRGWASAALTVILLVASAVVLYLRFHHAPFHVTEVAIRRPTPSGCGFDVTGQISTNGAAGAVSYQWLVQPGQHAPQPLSMSVAAGQNVVYVTVAVYGSGHGSASRTVTLQVLGPDLRDASTSVILRC
jgi:hypothetical protein